MSAATPRPGSQSTVGWGELANPGLQRAGSPCRGSLSFTPAYKLEHKIIHRLDDSHDVGKLPLALVRSREDEPADCHRLPAQIGAERVFMIARELRHRLLDAKQQAVGITPDRQMIELLYPSLPLFVLSIRINKKAKSLSRAHEPNV